MIKQCMLAASQIQGAPVKRHTMSCEGTWEADVLLRGVSIKEIGKRQSLRALVGRAESALATYRGEAPMRRVFLPHSRRELPPLRRLLPMGGSSRGRRLCACRPQNLHGCFAMQMKQGGGQ